MTSLLNLPPHVDTAPASLHRPTVLIVDDEPSVRYAFKQILNDAGELLEAADGATAVEVIRRHAVDVVLLDVRLPDATGTELLSDIKAIDDSIEVILVTAVREVRTAVDAIKHGAFDYLTKPVDVDEFYGLVLRAIERRALQRELLAFRTEWARSGGFDALVGHHPSMLRMYELVAQVAPTTATVFITGESGTGKELVARAIHRQSPRRERPFVSVNLAAIPDTLLESELFGYERGAFTGALQRKLGKFELAHGGSLLLDEVGSLRIDLQAKLLRVIQEREVERLGSTRSTPIDVRILAATNQDLKQAVRAGSFREDLYYRLNVVRIDLPPLRDRREDIPLLVDHFLEKYNPRSAKAVREVSPEALGVLMSYPWPGNVRELENIIERSVVLATGPVIHLKDLPMDLVFEDRTTSPARPPSTTLKDALKQIETHLILRALEATGWNQVQAAEQLGIHRNTLLLKLAARGIRRPDRPPEGPPIPPDPR